MTTFTIRVPLSMAGRLSSAQMRAWINDFLRAPGDLPGDPGPGETRVSLTLRHELVQSLAGKLAGPASTALRRLAALRLGLPANPMTANPSSNLRPVRPLSTPAPVKTPQLSQSHDKSGNSSANAAIFVVLFEIGATIVMFLLIKLFLPKQS